MPIETRSKVVVGITLISSVSLSSADVVTGLYQDHIIDYLKADQGGPLEVPAASTLFQVFADGSGFAETTIRSDFDNGVQVLGTERNPNNVFDQFFRQGESIGDFFEFSDRISLGGLSDDGFNDLVGEIGEQIFMGFRVINPDTSTNLGFIQLTRVGEFSFEANGWAYETEADADLIAFDVVPSPSTLALLGTGGLCFTRRRRT
jgi:hypothetical protein